jgi:cytochrome P450
VSESATALRRTPSVSGLRVAHETLLHGLGVDGAIVRGLRDSDIVRYSFAGRTAFVLGSPDYVDHVLHRAVNRYHKSVEYELLRTVVGLSVFTDEDESWRRHRLMLNPVLGRRHLAGLCELMVDPIEAFIDALDVVGAALFRRQLGDLARELAPKITDGLHAAELATRLIMVTNPPWWLTRLTGVLINRLPLLPPPLNRIQAIMHTIDDAVWDVIRYRESHPNDAADLLGPLLKARDEQGGLSLRRVRDEATTFMIAGHETTANALSWMWYLLALNTDARDRMLDEVDAALGSRRPTVEDLHALPSTSACFQEAMRIFPPAWAIPRLAIEDDVIDGHRIPRGSTVLIPIYSIHHAPRWWPEPERFDPTPFMPENARRHPRSAYLPFGGGRRVCIGQSFALMEATLIAAVMSQRFVYDLVAGHPVEPEATLTLRPRQGLKMVARRRSHSDPQRLAA